MDSFFHLTNEKELLTRLYNSDQQAFTDIYNLYWKKLFFVAAHKLHNLSEAEELVQDIFLDLWNRRHELQIQGNLSSYLAVCVKYKVINVLAKRNLKARYQQHAYLTSSLADQSTIQTLQLEELKKQLMAETNKLPHKCRLVFELSRNDGYTQKQIANRLRISEKTVEAHLSRALRALRTGLSHLMTFF